MKLADSKTFHNLARAFAGECMARTRYEFIEYGARQQGYEALAQAIDKVAYNEFNHARMCYTYLESASDGEISNVPISAGFPFKEKWNLTDNLRLAAEDERIEAQEIYPEFAATAEKEGFGEIAQFFRNLIQIETCHMKQFETLYDQMKSGKIYKRAKEVKWKCSGCGYENEAKEAWDTCPVCGAKQGAVMLNLPE